MPSKTQKKQTFQYAKKMIFLGHLFVPLIPYIFALTAIYVFCLNTVVENSHTTLQTIAQSHAKDVENYLEERIGDLQFILTTFSVEELSNNNTLAKVLNNLKHENDTYIDLGIINLNGDHVAYAGPYQLQNKNYSNAKWFSATLDNGIEVSDVFLGFRGVPHFVISIMGKGDNPIIIRATINSTVFSEIVQNIRGVNDCEAFLLNKKGAYQTQPKDKAPLLTIDPDFDSYTDDKENAIELRLKGTSGSTYIYALQKLNKQNWTLITRQKTQTLFAKLYETEWYLLMVTAVGGFLVFSMAFLVSKKISTALIETEEVKEHLRHRLSRSVRLAELGEMTASFAHEINNPLQIMQSELALIDLLKNDAQNIENNQIPPLGKEIEECLSQIQIQIDRCSQVTKSILRFGRQDKPEKTTIDFNKLLPEMVAMVKKRAELKRITIETLVLPDTPSIKNDAGKLQQVLLNLINNAIDAISEQHPYSGGVLRLTAELTESNSILVQVEDNGTGISKHILSNIFTPFFTTKPPQKGTGLGLAVCYGLIESMGGKIIFKTEKYLGTTFSILLPAT